jgi:20S proteasome subunit beta 6
MSEFNPYTDNGGTCVSIAGKDFAVIGSDKRHSEGYIINSRDVKRLYCVNDFCVIGTTSFHPDGLRLGKDLKMLSLKYNLKTKRNLSVTSLSQLLSNKLYSKRFFPFYSFNLLCGYNCDDNSGYLFSYDPVGSFERESFRASGTAASIIQPFLDSQVFI